MKQTRDSRNRKPVSLKGADPLRAQAPEQKRNRRIYTLKADDAMYAAFARYTFLTCEQAAQVTGREVDTLQKRFKNLYQAGHLNRVRQTDQYSLREPYVYFLDK